MGSAPPRRPRWQNGPGGGRSESRVQCLPEQRQPGPTSHGEAPTEGPEASAFVSSPQDCECGSYEPTS